MQDGYFHTPQTMGLISWPPFAKQKMAEVALHNLTHLCKTLVVVSVFGSLILVECIYGWAMGAAEPQTSTSLLKAKMRILNR